MNRRPKLPHGIKWTDWLVFDMDEGMLHVAPSRRAAVKRYCVDESEVVGRYTYGPGAYEYGFGMPGEDNGRQLWIYRADVAMRVGYAAVIEAGVRNFDDDED